MKCLTFEAWLTALHDTESQLNAPRSRYITWPVAHRSLKRQLLLHQLIYVEQGILFADTPAGTSELTPGCFLWLPPKTDRVLRSNDYCKTLRIQFSIERNNEIISWTDKPEVRFHCWESKGYLEKIWRMSRFGDDYEHQQLRALIALISINLQQSKTKEKTITRLTVKQCQKVETFIRENIRNNITASDIADELQMTRGYVTRLFKETYGCPPRQYIKEERLNRAAGFLLETNLQIKSIAREVGIKNLGLFCRLFKHFFGSSPSQYRSKAWSKDNTLIPEE